MASAPTPGEPPQITAAMNAPAAQSERSHSVHLDLGRVVATPAALDLVRAHGLDVLALVHRHARGDWGDVSEHDAQANDRSAQDGTRVLSAYETRGGRLWVITEADRSATTVLLPSDY